jgi:hypothetical protein
VRVLVVRRGAAAALRSSDPEVHASLQRARAAAAVQELVEAAGGAPAMRAEAELATAVAAAGLAAAAGRGAAVGGARLV